jgi:hypothetical protein
MRWNYCSTADIVAGSKVIVTIPDSEADIDNRYSETETQSSSGDRSNLTEFLSHTDPA